MRKLENFITLNNLERAKKCLVPHVLSKNYFNILKSRIQNKILSENERYYYNHFIKKKLKAMMDLFDINTEAKGKEYMKENRLKKAINIINKYCRKHKNMKLLISGSFLYSDKYNDIDLFAISKYNKNDYKDGKIHVNYLPTDIERTLFFKSILAISIANFKSDKEIKEEFKIDDILYLYEETVLLIMQKDDYLPELRNLIIRAEYVSNKVVLNSMQLKTITDKIVKSQNPIKILNKYIITKIINSFSMPVLKRTLAQFIKKNSLTEKGRKIYENWKTYNQTYKEALEVVT